jgi:GAF domain-containing protein
MTDSAQPPTAHLTEIASALEALTSVLVSTTHKETILQAVAEQVISVVPGADMASITILGEGGPYTSASTDPRAWQIDDAQYAEDDGPCLRAARAGTLVRVEVSTAEQLWPTFARVSGDLGVNSFLAAPLAVGQHAAGAVNLFSHDTHGFAEVDAQFLLLYTLVAQAAMHSIGRAHMAEEQVAQLRDAMASRAVIEQAKGILVGQRRCTGDEAFRILAKLSQDTNRKLRDVAQALVDTVTGPP